MSATISAQIWCSIHLKSHLFMGAHVLFILPCIYLRLLVSYPIPFQILFVSINSNLTGVTCGAGTASPSGAPAFNPAFSLGSCWSIFGYLCNVLLIVVCPFVLFLLAIVLSVLWVTASDYPFHVFKLFIYLPKPDSGANWSGKVLISE